MKSIFISMGCAAGLAANSILCAWLINVKRYNGFTVIEPNEAWLNCEIIICGVTSLISSIGLVKSLKK